MAAEVIASIFVIRWFVKRIRRRKQARTSLPRRLGQKNDRLNT